MSSHVHCDLCKKSKPWLVYCSCCEIAMCEDCSCSKENYFVNNIQDEPICNTCADRLEAEHEVLRSEVLFI